MPHGAWYDVADFANHNFYGVKWAASMSGEKTDNYEYDVVKTFWVKCANRI